MQEPVDNGDLGNVHGGGGSLYGCGVLICCCIGSIRQSNNFGDTSDLWGILDCVSCFNNHKPTSSVFMLAYLLSSTSTTVSSTVDAIDSIFCPLTKKENQPVARTHVRK